MAKQTFFILTHEWDDQEVGRDFSVVDIFTDRDAAYNIMNKFIETVRNDFKKKYDDGETDISETHYETSYIIDANSFEYWDEVKMHSIDKQ